MSRITPGAENVLDDPCSLVQPGSNPILLEPTHKGCKLTNTIRLNAKHILRGRIVLLTLITSLLVAGLGLPAHASPSDDRAGGIYAFGDAPSLGSTRGIELNQPIVGMASTASGDGYWLVARDGGIFSFGDATFHGSTGNIRLNQPIVGIAATPSGGGYWMVASDGGIFAFGDAPFFGSMGGTRLNQPVVGMAATADGGGYWLVARDGGIFSFGNATFRGSMGGTRLNQPVVGMAATSSGGGYWMVASDGGIFAFGDAPFHGSMGSTRLNKPVVGMAATPDGGYWMVASDGGVFAFGDAQFHGSTGDMQLSRPILGIASTPSGDGYWLYTRGGNALSPFDNELEAFIAGRQGRVSAAVYDKTTDQLHVYNNDESYLCASIVKVQIMAALLHKGASSGQRDLMAPMIKQSSNDAATTLWNQLGGGPAIQSFDQSIGMNATVAHLSGAWGLTETTASDQVQLMRHFAYPNAVLSDADRDFGVNLMRNVASGQAWGVSAGVTVGVTVALKNGWLPYGGDWNVNSIGWINGNGRDYVLAVLTDGIGSQAYGIETIQGVSSRVFTNLGR